MSWRDEEYRGGGTNLISRDGRGKLSWGEKQALAMQAKNQRTSAGEPNEVRQRQAARAVDAALRQPRRCGYP
jgi:hypothetical protein